MCQSKHDGARRCPSHASQRQAAVLIPRRGSLGKYYKATDTKHFGTANGPGSTFTDPKMRRLNDVVALAVRQRTDGLNGDDRAELIAHGAPKNAFRDDVRYLAVRTPGTVGVIRSNDMPDSTPVRVERHKPGAPCSFVVDVQDQPHTSIATVIIGSHALDAGREVVYTAHPGVPTPSSSGDKMSAREGQTVTLKEIRAVYGGDVWLNTRLI